MRIREYTSADFDALRRMHAAQGFGYPLPDLESPLFLAKLVLEDEDRQDEVWRDEATSANFDPNSQKRAVQASNAQNCGPQKPDAIEGREAACRDSLSASSRAASSSRVVMAVLLRLTAETYLLHDPAAGTPRLRWQRFLALHDAARQNAAARGLDDVQAFLPPKVARAFGRRLARLGWTHDPWTCYSKRV
jgi:hypothetical protein